MIDKYTEVKEEKAQIWCRNIYVQIEIKNEKQLT